MKKPFFSIIIPCYKSEGYVEEALQSVKNQTFVDFECILVSDGSPGISNDDYTDATKNRDFTNKLDFTNINGESQLKAIFDFVVKGDNRFKYFSKENGGQGSAKNLAIDNATGQFLLCLDSDDIYKPNHLRYIHDELLKRKNQIDGTVFLFDNLKEFYCENGTKVFRNKPTIHQKPKHPTFETYLVYNEVGTTFAVFKLDILHPLRYTKNTKTMEDVEIFYLLAAKFQKEGKKLNFDRISVDTVFHRLHHGSMTFVDSQVGFEKEKIDKINAYKNLINTESLTLRQKILCHLGIWRFSLVGKYGIFGKILKKSLTFLAKIISGWY